MMRIMMMIVRMAVRMAVLVRFAGVRFTWRIFLSIYNHINFGSADPTAIHAGNFQACTQVQGGNSLLE